MASNDQWPPVASAGKCSSKVNGSKRSIKDSQQKILSVVNEMFGSALEPEVILTVVQNCNWELQPSIEDLITLTETVDNPLVWNNVEKSESISSMTPVTVQQTSGLKGGNKEVPKTEIPTQEVPVNSQTIEPTLPSKWDKPKKGGSKNRMGSFCGNIAKLKSSGDPNTSSNTESISQKNPQNAPNPAPMDEDCLFNDILNYGASGVHKIPENPQKSSNFGDFPGVRPETQTVGTYPPAGATPWPPINRRSTQPSSVKSSSPPLKKDSNKKQNFQETKAAAEDKEFNQNRKFGSLECKTNTRKPDSESFCGLKVQYRVSGMESSSDDDADVVIEDESSDYKINLAPSMSINVSQFLSPSTQTAPQRTHPEFHMISTPSPPRTPQRNAYEFALNRIKATVQKGHRIMILLRGLPGSGKSTLAKSIVASTVGGNPAAYVFNTDDFFVTLGRGEYQFDPSRLQDAHSTNQKRVWNAVKEGRSPIIVDNTNTEAWEMLPYAKMAVTNGYIVEILEPNTRWAQNVHELAKKNTHNVPKSKIRERAKRYERVENGQRLLERFSLKYSAQNEPPRMRIVPPIETNATKVSTSIDDIKSNWGNHEKNNYILTSHDIESMQNIDESHSSIGVVSERASVATDSSESSSNPEKAANFRAGFDDYLRELQDSDDESFEMLDGSGSVLSDLIGKSADSKEVYGSHRSLASANLSPEENAEETALETNESSPASSQLIFGAIGSERKGSASVGNAENEKTETKNLSPSGSQQTLGAIGSERKGSLVGSSGGNLSCDKSENMDSNGLQPSLGAIGSERKGSFSVGSSVANQETEKPRKTDRLKQKREDNVLTQCWDFTLILGQNKIHSRHSRFDLPKLSTLKSVTKNSEDFAVISADNGEKIDDKTNRNNDGWNFDAVLNKNDFEDSKARNPAANFNDDSLSITEIQENLVETLEREHVVKNDETPVDEDTIDTRKEEKEATNTEIKTPELCGNEISVNLVKNESPSSHDERIDEATEVKEEEVPDILEPAPKVAGAFGSFFNMLKTSILGGADETSSTDLKNENLDVSGSSIYETAGPSSEKDPTDTIDSPGAVEKSSDADSPVEIATNDSCDATEKSADKDDEIYKDLSTNPFRDEIIKSREENHAEVELVTDNINSISWKESPFPIDGAKIPVLPSHDDNKTVEKSDAFTNTTYYDFNVAYVGGTSELGYRELPAFNRSINQGPKVAKLERPPVKLMLDKSSMTSEVNILATETNLTIEKEKDSSVRIQELVELFPNIPIDFLTAFYNQECKGNFDWAVEVLLDAPADFTIKRLEDKRSNLETDDSGSQGADLEKKSSFEHERLKKRSHSSSPRHRRRRTKDFRSFSMEFAEERNWASGEPSAEKKDANPIKDEEDAILESFYDEAASATSLPIGIGEIPEASSSSTTSGLTETEDDVDDFVELDFGRGFIDRLENTFGNTDFTFPDEFKPVIRIKKSMAEELHALWIQSMYEQLNERHNKLDKMIAKDEEIARALDRAETVQPTGEPVVPNLEEIMDMEMALASYHNELKELIARETPNDMASRLSRQMLYESLPDIDRTTLSEILKAHDGNFKETCETIETSTGRAISKTDTLKKQQSLLDRVKEESKNRGIPENLEDFAPLIVVNPDIYATAKAEKLSYKAAVARGQDARKEAQKQFSLRMENFNKAAEAYRKGHPGVAAYYSQMAKLHSENIEAARAEAADAFVSAQIDHTDDENTLDLHNFFVPEALLALDRFLEVQSKKLGKSNKRSSTLYIITGRGARSNNGLSKIKPAVSKKLISRNIRFTEANAGCLKVTLSKKSSILE